MNKEYNRIGNIDFGLSKLEKTKVKKKRYNQNNNFNQKVGDNDEKQD